MFKVGLDRNFFSSESVLRFLQFEKGNVTARMMRFSFEIVSLVSFLIWASNLRPITKHTIVFYHL